MEHLDEKILGMRELAHGARERLDQDSQFRDEQRDAIIKQIRDLKVTYNDLDFDMELRTFFKERFKMYMPKSFERMNPKQAKIKYPHESRPGIIFTNKADTINIGINYTEDELDDEDVLDFRNAMQQVYITVNPSAKILDSGEFKTNGKTIGYYSFSSFAIGGQMYNLMFVASFENRVLSCNLNCLKKEMKELVPLFYGIMNTIEIYEEI